MIWIFRILIGALFTFSGFMKLIHPVENFTAVLQSYDLFSASISAIIANTFPWMEFITGVFLLLGLWTRIALAISFLMNLVFISILSQALVRELPVTDCGCFGGAFFLKPWQTLVMDIGIALIFICLFISLRQTKSLSLDRFFDHD